METVNPLRSMRDQTKRGIWIPLEDFAALVRVEFRKAGYDLDTTIKMSTVFAELKLWSFVEHHEDNFASVRICGEWYESV